MANPQIENGYTKVANEIVEALCAIRIPGEARQVIDVVIRKTYGYNKKEDHISLSQFCLSTRMRRGDVCRAINKAVEMNIIKVISKKANAIGNIYSVVKDFDSWKPLAKKRRGVAKKLMSISKKANLVVAKKRHTKDSIKYSIKDTYSASEEITEIRGEELEEAIPDLRPIQHANVNNEYSPEFLEMFEIYPKKVGKRAANAVWEKLRPPTDRVRVSILSNKKTREWQEEGGRYVPHFATWLQGERWEDEVKEKTIKVLDLSK